MRTVLIGSDFMYNSSGDLIPIEINTNVGWSDLRITGEENPLDLTDLASFITTNGFTDMVYIGNIYDLNVELKNLSTTLGLTYVDYSTSSESITVPFVEDNDTTLIIRSAYDTTAIVDDTYCADKVNFMKLIEGQTFGSQIAYYNDNNVLINNITTIKDNGNNPNFILKAVRPKYDKNVYPKFFKVSNQDELNVVLENVSHDYFLMEFHYNSNNLYENILPTYRTLNILFPPSLNSIKIGGYTCLPSRKIDGLSTYDTTTFELTYNDRLKYISENSRLNNPKLLPTDKVEMADGTFKTAEELQIGDLVKSINIANPNNIDLSSEHASFGIDYQTFLSGSTYTSKAILNKVFINKLTEYNTITFTDNTTWDDVEYSAYLAIRNDEVRFLYLTSECFDDNCLKSGDDVILIDASQPTITPTLKKISSITTNKLIFNGYEITVEDDHMFLTVSEDNTSSFVAIEHNVTCVGCAGICPQCTCAKGQKCINNMTFLTAINGKTGRCFGTCT